MVDVRQFLASLPALDAADSPWAAAELRQLAIEAWGWQPLSHTAYLHLGKPAATVMANVPVAPAVGPGAADGVDGVAEVSVVGVIDGDMQGLNLLWLP